MALPAALIMILMITSLTALLSRMSVHGLLEGKQTGSDRSYVPSC